MSSFDLQRLGQIMEPEEEYERWPDGRGGGEDPRIAFVERLQLYVMTYTGHTPGGPRIVLAVSEDLLHWKRLGLATFEPYRIDVYYGMADSRIGVARLDVPEFLPPGAAADGDGPKNEGQE